MAISNRGAQEWVVYIGGYGDDAEVFAVPECDAPGAAFRGRYGVTYHAVRTVRAVDADEAIEFAGFVERTGEK